MRSEHVIEMGVGPSRREKAAALITCALERGSMTSVACISLAMKMRFAISPVFGRVGKAALLVLHDLASQGGGQLTQVHVEALAFYASS